MIETAVTATFPIPQYIAEGLANGTLERGEVLLGTLKRRKSQHGYEKLSSPIKRAKFRHSPLVWIVLGI